MPASIIAAVLVGSALMLASYAFLVWIAGLCGSEAIAEAGRVATLPAETGGDGHERGSAAEESDVWGHHGEHL